MRLEDEEVAISIESDDTENSDLKSKQKTSLSEIT